MAVYEAPEGILVYSWSGNLPSNYVDINGSIYTVSTVITGIGYGTLPLYGTVYTPANIAQVGQNAYIDYGNPDNDLYINTEEMVLSDSLIETLDLISEGVIDGPLSGQWIFSGNLNQIGWSTGIFSGYNSPVGQDSSKWLRFVYWNNLPVLNDNGQFNFQNIDLAYTVGTPNGDIIQELTSEETTSRSIGVTLYANNENIPTSQIFRINNPNCKGVIVNINIPSLSSTYTSTGNIYRTAISINIYYRPVFSTINKISDFIQAPTTNSLNQNLLIVGKLSKNGYIASARVDFNLNSFSNNGLTVNDSNGFLNDSDFIG